MNIGAHIAVAEGRHRRRAGPGREAGPADPGELLGSALPDLASMARFRLRGGTDHEGVRAGIQLHHRTDDTFHRHPWFLQRQRALVDDLSRRGFGRGPALACGHAGIELLLDGVLLAHPPLAAASQRAFDAIPRLGPALAGLVDPAHQERWRTHLDRFAGRPPLGGLDDPDQVADRLYRILARRPRLAFERHQRPALAAALAQHRPEVAETGAQLVEDLVDQLLAAEGGDGFGPPWTPMTPA